MPLDVERQVAEWRAEALAGARVSREICTEAGELLNYHARVIPRPVDEIYRRLSMMGGGLDDCWPLPSVPMKVDGAFAPGVRAGHGPIRYELVAVDPSRRIEWRFTMDRLHGRYEYRLAPADDGALIENVIDGSVTEALFDVWPSALGRLHDWVMERLFDRLAEPPAPWFDSGKIAEIR